MSSYITTHILSSPFCNCKGMQWSTCEIVAYINDKVVSKKKSATKPAYVSRVSLSHASTCIFLLYLSSFEKYVNFGYTLSILLIHIFWPCKIAWSFDIVMPLETYRIAYIIKRPIPYSYFSDKYRKQYFKLITNRIWYQNITKI